MRGLIAQNLPKRPIVAFARHKIDIHPNWLIVPSSFALVFTLPPWGFTHLVWFALIPWLYTVEKSKNILRATLAGFGFSLCFGVGTLYPVAYAYASYQETTWIGGLLMALLTSLVFQLQFPLFAALFWWVRGGMKRTGWLIVWATSGVYTGLDWVLPKPFGDTLGLVFHQNNWLRQCADLGGPYVLTFLVIACNLCLLDFVLDLQKKDMNWQDCLKRHWFALLNLALIGSFCLGYGIWRSNQWSDLLARPSSGIKVGIVQGNLPLAVKRLVEQGDDAAAEQTLSTYLRLSDEIRNQDHGPPDLIVWPETTYPGLFRKPFSDRQAHRNVRFDVWIQKRQQAIIFGAYDGELLSDGRLRQYNALFALIPSPEKATRPALAQALVYRKNRLVPFGETVPWLEENQLLRTLFPHVSFFGRGAGPQVLSLALPGGKTVVIGPSVCYEDFFAAYTLAQAQQGASLLINVSNDGWFGPYLVRQFHLAQAVFRSVETRLPQVRAASSGISGMILPDGEFITKTGPAVQAQLSQTLPIFSDTATPLKHTGMVFPPLMLCAGALVLIWLWLVRFRSQ